VEAALAGWTNADLFVTGLHAIGRDVSRSRLVAAINRLTSFTADGILAPVDWRTGHQAVTGPTNSFVVVHAGRFVPVYDTAPSVFSCYPVPPPDGLPINQVVPLPPGVPPLPAPSMGRGDDRGPWGPIPLAQAAAVTDVSAALMAAGASGTPTCALAGRVTL